MGDLPDFLHDRRRGSMYRQFGNWASGSIVSSYDVDDARMIVLVRAIRHKTAHRTTKEIL